MRTGSGVSAEPSTYAVSLDHSLLRKVIVSHFMDVESEVLRGSETCSKVTEMVNGRSGIVSLL